MKRVMCLVCILMLIAGCNIQYRETETESVGDLVSIILLQNKRITTRVVTTTGIFTIRGYVSGEFGTPVTIFKYSNQNWLRIAKGTKHQLVGY